MNDHASYLNRPVFVSGYHKSGTTLFLSILDGHPELVVIPEELNFFKAVLYQKDKAKAIRENSGFKMFLGNQEMPEWEHWRTFYREGYPEFDQTKFNQLFEQALKNSQSFKDLMLKMVKAFAEVDHVDPATKRRWAAKTPLEEIYFPLMHKMFGKECRFVYAVRDPRDVYTSISKWKENRGKASNQDIKSVINFCIYWQTRMNKAVSYQKKYDNVCVLRYEDLLLNTENTLKQLCAFLQIEYSQELLQPTRHGKEWGGNSAYSEGFKGISGEPIGRYQKTLDPQIRSIIERLLQKEMAAFGYMENGAKPAAEADGNAIPWQYYRTTLMKYQLRYLLDQSYIRLRYNFPQLH